MEDEILKGTGLKFEDLTPFEKETYLSRLKKIKEDPFTVEKVLYAMQKMREAVELELVEIDEYKIFWIFRLPNRKHLELKARLKNYLLLEQYITGVQRMKKKAVEEAA